MIKDKIYNYELAREKNWSFEKFLISFLSDRETDSELLKRAPEYVKFDIFNKFNEMLAEMDVVVENGKKIIVIGDYDVDGITSTAILYKTLSKIYAKENIDYILPDRKEDGYGFSPKLLEKAKAKNVGLIITVDNGINAIPAILKAISEGIQVILTDHHLPNDDEWKKVKYVMNPHLEGTNSLKCKEVCGAYVSLLFALQLIKNKNVQLSSKELMELEEIASVGTVADVMPIEYENRYLLKDTTNHFKKGVVINRGLNLLVNAMSKFDLSDLEQENIGFYLAPAINASGRLETADIGLKLLITDNLQELGETVAKLITLNEIRKNATNDIAKYLEKNIIKENKVQVLQVPKNYLDLSDREIGGIIGIVAQKVVEISNCPSLIFYGNRFSGRSKDDVDLNKLLSTVNIESFNFGGHSQACGGSIDFDKDSKELIKQLNSNIKDIEITCYNNFIRVPNDLEPLEILKTFDKIKPCDLTKIPRLIMEDLNIFGFKTLGDKHSSFAIKMNDEFVNVMKFNDTLNGIGKQIKRLEFKVTKDSYRGGASLIAEQVKF